MIVYIIAADPLVVTARSQDKHAETQAISKFTLKSLENHFPKTVSIKYINMVKINTKQKKKLKKNKYTR